MNTFDSVCDADSTTITDNNNNNTSNNDDIINPNNNNAFQVMTSCVGVTPWAKGADLQGLVWPAQVLQIQGQPRPPLPSTP